MSISNIVLDSETREGLEEQVREFLDLNLGWARKGSPTRTARGYWAQIVTNEGDVEPGDDGEEDPQAAFIERDNQRLEDELQFGIEGDKNSKADDKHGR